MPSVGLGTLRSYAEAMTALAAVMSVSLPASAPLFGFSRAFSSSVLT